MSNAAASHEKLQRLLDKANKMNSPRRKASMLKVLGESELAEHKKEIRRQHRLHQEIILASVDSAFIGVGISEPLPKLGISLKGTKQTSYDKATQS